MRRLTLVAFVLLSFVGSAAAEERKKLEVGTSLGIAFSFTEGNQVTTFAAPGAGTFFGLAALYLTTFPHPNVMVEPQIHFQVIYREGNNNSVISGILQIGYLFTPERRGSFYFAGHGGALLLDANSSNTLAALGLGAGYRWEVGRGGAVRLEARYRRWFDEGGDVDELTFALGVGGIFN